MEMKGKVIVVTGGASGIGAALCRRFAAEGAAAIVVADLDETLAVSVAAEVNATVPAVAFRVNVGDEDEIQALVAFSNERYGRIDVFVSNAGISTKGGLESPNADWDRIWAINTMAHVYAARAVVPQMLERGEGYLLQTASAAGLLTQVDSPTYAVTKHAAVAFAEWLAINYGDKGIRVSCLCPQGVKTPLLMGKDGSRQSFLVAGAMEADDVATSVLEAMRDERFLVLPHEEVLTFMQRKTGDYDRWLRGMRKVRQKAEEMRALNTPAP